METLKARVKGGRLVLDEPTDLPEGTVLELQAADPGDELDPEDREALHKALTESWASACRGELEPASTLLDESGEED